VRNEKYIAPTFQHLHRNLRIYRMLRY